MFLLYNVFYQLPRPELGAVDIALGLFRHAFSGAGAFHLQRIGNAIEHLADLDATDADATLPARMGRHAVGFGVGAIKKIGANLNASRPAELSG